ncbi:precorrin-8X methylmutase [Cyanobacteria bacterium FACHB-472]|nr:precorrin-8X methylmutase [Cyanobacteria bacterium FACHB-472]
MTNNPLTIKNLIKAVGGGLTPRMVRHYHTLGLLPPAKRSHGNYRLYTDHDVQHLRRIVALKQQGFQLSHIQKLLATDSMTATNDSLMTQLQQQYRSVMQYLGRLRQTASALEGLLGRDRECLNIQLEAIDQLRQLEVETITGFAQLEKLWDGLDAATHTHPEEFQESLEHLLPDLSDRSEIEVDLLKKLVLACGDVSLVDIVRVSENAIASARDALNAGCQIVADVKPVFASLDQTRLAHLGCEVVSLIDDPHITSVTEAEHEFWQHRQWRERLQQLNPNCVLVVGYAPSVLMAASEAIENGKLQPALIIGMPIGFSHAPSAKRRLMRSGVPFITSVGTLGGGLLAAIALNALAESLIEKPNCHCYLG